MSSQLPISSYCSSVIILLGSGSLSRDLRRREASQVASEVVSVDFKEVMDGDRREVGRPVGKCKDFPLSLVVMPLCSRETSSLLFENFVIGG